LTGRHSVYTDTPVGDVPGLEVAKSKLSKRNAYNRVPLHTFIRSR